MNSKGREFVPFSSIGQYRNSVKEYQRVSKFSNVDSKVKLTGSVKLHGTNAAICFTKDNIWFQSRNNIITSLSDNCGFAAWGEGVTDKIEELRDTIYLADNEIYCLFGEWIGKGVQKNVAVSELEKQFVPFESGISYDGKLNYFSAIELQDQLNRTDFLHSIYDCGSYELEIDFENPSLYQEKLIELTTAVENECPFGKYHGVLGVGEGIVWHYDIDEKRYRFKVKGDKHSGTKVKKLKPVDTEKEQKIVDFVNDYACTANRLSQAYTETISDNDRAKTGLFLKWIFQDIIKEESDILESIGLATKDINSKVAFVAKKWLFEKIDSEF